MKNKVQFQKGYSLIDFMTDDTDETKCREAIFKARWPDGYHCSECGSSSYCTLKSRARFQCNRCHHQQSLTSGTIFEATKLPLTKWFLAIHLLTQAKTGVSALALMRQMGVSYNTAWSIKQKLMQVMKERDDSKPLEGIVQLDDVYWGGELRGGKHAMNGVYHSIKPKHLPRYLAEFCYRFNRRFKLENMLPRFVYVSVRAPPMPERLLRVAALYG